MNKFLNVYLNNILRRKASWIGHILRRNCLLHHAIGGQMTEVKEVGRRRRRIQLFDDLRNRRRYWELKEELKIEKDGNDSLSIKHKEKIQVIIHKSNDPLISRIPNNNGRNNRIEFRIFRKATQTDSYIKQKKFQPYSSQACNIR